MSANNLDPDDVARFSLVNTPEHGIVKPGITKNRFVYTPNAGFAGEDIFTYKATNGKGVDSNVATIGITVKPHPSLTPTSYSNESNAVAAGIPRPPERNKQYQQQPQRSQFGNPKVLIPIIAVIAVAVIILVVFGSGIMHQQQPPSPTSAPPGNPNPNPNPTPGSE